MKVGAFCLSPSGSGKTHLLNQIADLIPAHERIHITVFSCLENLIISISWIHMELMRQNHFVTVCVNHHKYQ